MKGFNSSRRAPFLTTPASACSSVWQLFVMFAQDVLDGMQMTPKAFEAFPSNSWQNSYQ